MALMVSQSSLQALVVLFAYEPMEQTVMQFVSEAQALKEILFDSL